MMGLLSPAGIVASGQVRAAWPSAMVPAAPPAVEVSALVPITPYPKPVGRSKTAPRRFQLRSGANRAVREAGRREGQGIEGDAWIGQYGRPEDGLVPQDVAADPRPHGSPGGGRSGREALGGVVREVGHGVFGCGWVRAGIGQNPPDAGLFQKNLENLRARPFPPSLGP